MEEESARRETEERKCAYCRMYVPLEESVSLGGKQICLDCLDSYCQQQYKTFGKAYLILHKAAFLDWWFHGLEQTDQERLLWEVYEKEKAQKGPAYYDSWEKDYCLESPDWREYVMDALGP